MHIHETVLHWLLESDNPPVRYLTLTNLLQQPSSNSAVQDAKAHLMDYAVTRSILSHSQAFWADEKGAYRKYTGQYWQMIFLGQFLADGSHPLIITGITRLLQHRRWIAKDGGHCLTANLLTALRRLGFAQHPIVCEETEALALRIVADDGIRCTGMAYSLLPHCYMALPKLLLCFGEIPDNERSQTVKAAIALIVEAVLAHEVFVYVPEMRKAWATLLAQQPRRIDLPHGQTVKDWIAEQRTQFLTSHGLGKLEAKQGWRKFGFPHHYNSDIVEAMYALALVRTPMSPSLQKSLQMIRAKETSDGKWRLDTSLNGKMWADVEEQGKASKWLTYYALFVLTHFDGGAECLSASS